VGLSALAVKCRCDRGGYGTAQVVSLNWCAGPIQDCAHPGGQPPIIGNFTDLQGAIAQLPLLAVFKAAMLIAQF